jgi:MFS family permease
MRNLIRFLAMLFAAISLCAAMAHLLELRVKINLSKENYQVVQGIYSGWQWLGIFEIGAIILTMIWIIIDRKLKYKFSFLITGLICFILSIIVFFVFTFPTNQETLSWTNLPNNWDELRKTWEYSHAIRASLSLFGFSFLVLYLLKRQHR